MSEHNNSGNRGVIQLKIFDLKFESTHHTYNRLTGLPNRSKSSAQHSPETGAIHMNGLRILYIVELRADFLTIATVCEHEEFLLFATLDLFRNG